MNARNYLLFFYSFTCSVIIAYITLTYVPLAQPKLGDISDILPSYQSSVFPQNHKMIYYTAGSFILCAGTLLFYALLSRFIPKHIQEKQWLQLILSLVAGILLLGGYSMTLLRGFDNINSLAYVFTMNPVMYSQIFHFMIVVGLALLSIIFFLHHPLRMPISLSKAIARNRTLFRTLLSFVSLLLISITLFDRTFDEHWIFLGGIVQYVHTIPFVAAIHDVLMGKVILVDADSQYGLLLAYLPALIFRILPLTMTTFFYFLILCGIFYYISAYVLIRIRLGGSIWPLLTLIMLFSMHFYPSFDRYTRPMVFPLRYIPDMLFFILLFLKPNVRSRIIQSFYVSVAFYYSYEIGISLFLSYLSYLFVIYVSNQDKRKKLISSLILPPSIVLGAIIFLGSCYTLFAKYRTGMLPDWGHALFYIKIFSLGFTGGGDPPLIGFHLIVLTIYFIVLLRALRTIFSKNISQYSAWDGALAVYGLIILTYFIKSPYILNLAVLSVPAIILTGTLMQELWNGFVTHSSRDRSLLATVTYLPPFLVLSSIFVFSITFYLLRLNENRNHQYWHNEPERQESAVLYTDIVKSASSLNRYTPTESHVTLLSHYDGFINLLAGKTNSLRLTNAQLIITKSQVAQLLDELIKLHPKYIYADTDTREISYEAAYYGVRTKMLTPLFVYLNTNYHRIATEGILDIWERT